VVSVTSSGSDSNCHQYKRQQNRRFNLRVVLHEMGSRSICGIKRSKVANLISPCYKTALQRIYLQSLEFRPSCLLFRIYFRYKGVWLITRCGSLMENGYNIKHFPRCLVFLTLTGILSRCAAFFCMVTFQKK